MTENPNGALAGVLVVDASRILAGPYAAMLLGDLGADVVKVEQPGRGDDTRQWGPPFAASGESAYYLAVNRSKRGIAIELGRESGRGVLDTLLLKADVLIENFKVRTREEFALSRETTRIRYPRLVHAAISGFGATGSFAARPGYDNVVQAASGLMSITGPVDGPPSKVGVAVVDLATGLQAAVAILAALRHRDATGVGQFIDVSLFDASLGLLANVASSVLLSGEAAERWGNAHPSIVPYETIDVADGRVMLAVGNDAQFRALCGVLSQPGWADDPRFATNPGRVVHRETLIPMIRERFSRKSVAEWTARLESAGVPASPVRTVSEALACAESLERGMVVSVAGVPTLAPVPKLEETPARATPAPRAVGEHTDAVLTELLGYDRARIAALRESGAVA